MHQDSFRSVVCRSLSKSRPSRSKDGIHPETVDVPCVVTLQPSISRGREHSQSQSYREERSMSFNGDYLTAPSLSKHFAEDLLRGAMDLQESLAMLERFQAASQSMRQSNMKSRPGGGERSPDIDTIVREVLLRPSNAKQVLPKTVSNGLHRQVSNSTDELKNVVKDSLHRNNISSVSSSNEQAPLSHSARYLPSNFLVSKTSQQKKVVPTSLISRVPVQPDRSKSPSLVAKLMGLDGLPSQNDNSIMKDEKIKTVSSPRAWFDDEMPRSKRILPPLFGDDSRFDTEMRRSQMLPPEDYNVRTSYTSSQKGISRSYNTIVMNETGLVNPVHRERNVEQVRPKPPREIKVVSHTSRTQQTKETAEIKRRTREKQKSHLVERNREGRKDVMAKARPVSPNAQGVKRPDKKLGASSSSHSCNSMKPILQKAPNNSRKKIVSRRKIKTSTIDDIVAHQIQREIIYALDEIDSPSTEYSATPSDESGPSTDWDAESSVNDTPRDFSESTEASVCTSHAETERTNSTDGDTTCSSADRIPAKVAEISDEIILLLLSDQWFLAQAAELIGTGPYEHLADRYKGISKVDMRNRKLYLDTAAEQQERKRRQQNSLCYTGFQGQKCGGATTYLSLEELLRDVSNGIRKLNGYLNEEDAGGTKDGLGMKLERDLLGCADESINGAWDMGWQDWVFMEETECFVRDAGEDILSLLIEEAALEMCVH